GPSSSGKTTTTIKIGERLKKDGYSLVTLNVDNYYFDLKDQLRDTLGDYDYETPQAIDLELLSRHLRALLAGETVQIPYYNFKTGNREGISKEMVLGEKDILLIDSLHGMFEEMTAGIDEGKKFKLYIETLSQVKDSEGRFIRWADIRMLRRMVRDMQYRNYSPKQTLAHWHYVRRSELRYIISRISKAHFIVNSFLPYELPLMKHRLGGFFPQFINELKDCQDREDAFRRAQRVQGIFNEIPAWADESVVPKSSLLREFIGGSGYSY
ncbi:MAG: response regulator SirA, partial [Spirochaetes bacterium]|nr:response regulator SirA [Spirochaetota bacterium]